MKRSPSKLFAPRMGIFLTVLAAFLMVLSPAGAAAGTNTGECNQDTADALLQENPDIDHAGPPFVVGQVLCGEFLGPGSQAMVIAFSPPTCGGFFGWAVFSRQEGSPWQLVWTYRNGQTNLAAIGSDLEETNNIIGPHDARCTGVKATKTRIWHWDGKKFVAGPWTLHLLGTAPSFIAQWPRFGIICSMADDPNISAVPGNHHNGVSCISGKSIGKRTYRQKADLRVNGQVRICQKYGPSSCIGSYCGCAEDFTEVHIGEQVVVGRFTCRVLKSSVECTNTIGQGFVINPRKIRRLS